MNIPGPSAPAITPDQVRNKADILETNLFKSISKQGNPFVLQFQIDRKMSPDPVIVKALLQLLPRLNLRAPKILIYIKKLLDRPVPSTEKFKFQKTILDLASAEDPQMTHLTITFRAIVTARTLAIEIRGTAPEPGINGAIHEAFFDYKSCPGLVRADGVIDFREINKYPIVKKGDNLFLITPPVQGRPGIQYDGKVVPVDTASALNITLKDGVERVTGMDAAQDRQGYYIRATRTGVVVLTRQGSMISHMEVRDALDINRLDYATGNIGTGFICPISMTIDTICNGFKIRAKGSVTVRQLDGGEIETQSEVLAQMVQPGSLITAQGDITVHFARRARISSAAGKLTITDEISDTRADATSVCFEKSRGILSGTTLDAQIITLKGIYLNGENTIYFGRRLFQAHQDLLDKQQGLKQECLDRETEQKAVIASLQDELRNLSRTLKTHLLLKENLTALIAAARDMNYPAMYKELDTIGQTMNTREVIQIRKLLGRLQLLPAEIQAIDMESETMDEQINHVCRQMDRMKLNIDGFLRRAGALTVFTPDAEDDAPAVMIVSGSDTETRISVQGSYSAEQGFEITHL